MRVISAFLAAVAILLALPAVSRADSAFTPAQKEELNKLIHDYILANPGVLLEAVAKERETEQKQAAEETHQRLISRRNDLVADPADPVLGDPKGDVTIVEFFDFRCPYCKATHKAVADLLQSDKHVRLVTKNFPILGPDSVYASQVALVAQRHGKYAEFYNGLFEQQQKLTPEIVLSVAKSLGLDAAEIKHDMADPEIDARLDRNRALGTDLHVEGTPAFIIGDTLVAEALTSDELRSMVAKVRDQAK